MTSPEEPVPDHRCLPDWQSGDLPEPLPLTGRNVLRTIGPGAILLAGSIGGGDWIVGPFMAVQYGTGILWVATLAIFLQMIFNLEAIRYTLDSSEPVLTGIMRLTPGSRFWGWLYILAGVAQLATPAPALGCANVLFAAAVHREPVAADGGSLMWVSYAILAGAVVLLLSGRSVERTLERLSWAMIVFIFAFLLLGVFAATAGSGGLGNLVISNWTRDKGFGMAAGVGSIGGVLSGEGSDLAGVGRDFPPTPDNLRRWSVWWNTACSTRRHCGRSAAWRACS